MLLATYFINKLSVFRLRQTLLTRMVGIQKVEAVVEYTQKENCLLTDLPKYVCTTAYVLG